MTKTAAQFKIVQDVPMRLHIYGHCFLHVSMFRSINFPVVAIARCEAVWPCLLDGPASSHNGRRDKLDLLGPRFCSVSQWVRTLGWCWRPQFLFQVWTHEFFVRFFCLLDGELFMGFQKSLDLWIYGLIGYIDLWFCVIYGTFCPCRPYNGTTSVS